MIDENKLINELYYYRDDVAILGNNEEYLPIIKIIELVESQQPQRWISVKEKLPDNDDCCRLRYFVTMKHREGTVRAVTILIYANDHWEWENGKRLSDKYEVLAWQRRWYPNPYEGE